MPLIKERFDLLLEIKGSKIQEMQFLDREVHIFLALDWNEEGNQRRKMETSSRSLPSLFHTKVSR